MTPFQTVSPNTKTTHNPSLLDRVILTRSRSNLPTLYLSGPMSGLPGFNFDAFNEFARKMRFLGFPVLNPADFGKNATHRESLGRDISVLTHADIVILLDGWERSKGAGTEMDVAIGLGIPLVLIDEIYEKVLKHFFSKPELGALAALDERRQELGVGFDKAGNVVLGKREDVQRFSELLKVLADVLGGDDDEAEDDDDDLDIE